MQKLSLRAEIRVLHRRLARPVAVVMLDRGKPAQFEIGGFRHILVILTDRQGNRGAGYCRAGSDPEGTARLVADHLEGAASEADLLDPSLDRPRGRMPRRALHEAASAVALAAWDLRGRRLNMACADLWQPGERRKAIDCYYSGFWIGETPAELAVEARMRRAAGFRAVKLRAALSLEEDIERLDAVRAVFPEPGVIAVEALGAWSLERARRFVERVDAPLLWLEDPFPPGPRSLADYRTLAKHSPHAIVSGEDCCLPGEIAKLTGGGGLQKIILELGALGGPMRFLRVARDLCGRGIDVGSHLYAAYSAHILAALPGSLPLEVADWADYWFRDPVPPDESGLVAVRGPGFGIGLDEKAIEANSEFLAVIELEPDAIQ